MIETSLSRPLHTHPLIKLSLDETGGDAAHGVAVVRHLRPADGEACGLGGQPGVQVKVDGALEVAVILLHLPGLLVLTRLRQPLVVAPAQAVQLRVALCSRGQSIQN